MVCKCFSHNLIGVRSEVKIIKSFVLWILSRFFLSPWVGLVAFIQNVNIQYLVVIFNCWSLKIKLLATLIITCRYAELISNEIRNENWINANASMCKTRISQKKNSTTLSQIGMSCTANANGSRINAEIRSYWYRKTVKSFCFWVKFNLAQAAKLSISSLLHKQIR